MKRRRWIALLVLVVTLFIMICRKAGTYMSEQDTSANDSSAQNASPGEGRRKLWRELLKCLLIPLTAFSGYTCGRGVGPRIQVFAQVTSQLGGGGEGQSAICGAISGCNRKEMNRRISNDEVNCEFKDFSSAPDLTILRQSAVRSSIFRGSLSADKRILPSPGSAPGKRRTSIFTS